MALSKDQSERYWQSGWSLIHSWQRPDGGWQAGAKVSDPHWATSLAVTMLCAMGQYDAAFRRGVDWLVSLSGAETRLMVRVLSLVGPTPTGHDMKYRGWPWRMHASAWIEPTAHALIALHKSADRRDSRLLRSRIEMGEGTIVARRCKDGGWNYGHAAALGVDLPSYPETTALALLGLQRSNDPAVPSGLASVGELWPRIGSRMARSWLAICKRVYGEALPLERVDQPLSRDVVLTALEALARPDGHWHFFQVTGPRR